MKILTPVLTALLVEKLNEVYIDEVPENYPFVAEIGNLLLFVGRDFVEEGFIVSYFNTVSKEYRYMPIGEYENFSDALSCFAKTYESCVLEQLDYINC